MLCCCSITASTVLTAEGVPARLQRKLADDLAACPRLKVPSAEPSIAVASALLLWTDNKYLEAPVCLRRKLLGHNQLQCGCLPLLVASTRESQEHSESFDNSTEMQQFAELENVANLDLVLPEGHKATSASQGCTQGHLRRVLRF